MVVAVVVLCVWVWMSAKQTEMNRQTTMEWQRATDSGDTHTDKMTMISFVYRL